MLFMRLLNAIRRWYARRVTVRRLSELSDHWLRDIGIQRHEIEAAVYRSSGSTAASHMGIPEVFVSTLQRDCGAPTQSAPCSGRWARRLGTMAQGFRINGAIPAVCCKSRAVR